MDCSPPGDHARQEEASAASKLRYGARTVLSLCPDLDKLLVLGL